MKIFLFFSDVPDHSTGLEIELWECGQFWDKLLGLSHICLDRDDDEDVENIKTNVNERWIILDSELILNDQGQVSNPTGHSLLIHIYIEFPLDLTDEESRELTEKLEILHEILDKKVYITKYFFFIIVFLF